MQTTDTVQININNDIQDLFKASKLPTFSDYVNGVLQMEVDKKKAWAEFYAKIDAARNSGYVKCDEEFLLKFGEGLGISRERILDSWKSN